VIQLNSVTTFGQKALSMTINKHLGTLFIMSAMTLPLANENQPDEAQAAFLRQNLVYPERKEKKTKQTKNKMESKRRKWRGRQRI